MFKRDLKKAVATPEHRDAAALLEDVAAKLARDEKHRDHALNGDWTNHRECHLKPDQLLIREKPDEAVLRLVRLGSHSDLF